MSRMKADRKSIRISTAESEEEIGNSYEVMRVLRTELGCRETFVAQIRRQQNKFEYVLLTALSCDNSVVGVAGFHPQENLMHGLHIYVDDLVTAEAWRNRGIGAALMEDIIRRACASRYGKILLDTGRLNEAAHRFYAGLGFSAKALRFSLDLAHGPSIEIRN